MRTNTVIGITQKGNSITVWRDEGFKSCSPRKAAFEAVLERAHTVGDDPDQMSVIEVFAGDSAQTQRTLALLADCTRAHHDKLRKVWQQNGGG